MKRTAIARSTKPIRKKRSKPRRGPAKDLAYLEFLRTLPCCVCAAWAKNFSQLHSEARQVTITEAAHVGTRGLGQKCDDLQALPICIRHHRSGYTAAHWLGKKFWTYHSLDRDALIAQYNKQYDEQQWALGPEWTRVKGETF